MYYRKKIDVIVDIPLAIIYKNVKTKLTIEKAEIILGDKVSIINTKSIDDRIYLRDWIWQHY